MQADAPLPDDLMRRYVPGGYAEIPIAEHIHAQVPFGSACAVMLLAECYQVAGRLNEAIGLVQQLHETVAWPAVLLSLCDLFADQGAWDEIVDASAGTRNDDDVTCAVATFVGRESSEQGLPDAAMSAFKEALHSTKRDQDVLNEARYCRARHLQTHCTASKARADFERILATDPDFRDVRARLAEPKP